MLETISGVEWSELPQPKSNSPDEVPTALRQMIHVQNRTDAQSAYHRVLFALGNDHAGTYYPVALHAVPFLIEMLGHDKDFVREAALDVLVDLLGAFEAEAGFRAIHDASGIEVPLNTALHDAVAGFRPQIELRASAASKASREYDLLRDLMALIE
ncbi:MAG: hypothetical protein ABSD59_19275 [Terracidiphilus sp.]|jgi:hypothetical protein